MVSASNSVENKTRAGKSRFACSILSLALAGIIFPSLPIRAANETWNGGDGTWSTAGAWNGSNWVSGNAAIFNAAAGTVTVGTQTVSGLTFNVPGYSLASGTLTLATGAFIATTTGTTTFASTLSLAGATGVSLTKAGSGLLSLSTANSSLGTAANPGSWTVSGGTLTNGTYDSVLSVNLGNNLGATPTAAATQVTLNSGTLQVRGAGSPAIGATRSIQVNSGGGAIMDSSGGSNSYLSNIADNAGSGSSMYLSNTGGTATFSGILSGTGGLTWNGTGTLLLSGTNTYTGATTVNAGILQFAATANLGSASGTFNLNGGTLASAQTAAVTMTRTIATGTTGGTIQLNNGLPSAGTSKLTLATSGQLTGSGPITLTNNGVLSIGAANTGFSGNWTLNGGVLELTNGTAGGTGSITVNSAAELSTLGSQISNPLVLNGGRIGWDYYSGSGNYQGPVTLQGGGGVVSLVNFYGTGAISGTISGNISGTGGLSTSDTGPSTGSTTTGGVLTLLGNNSYTGGTTIGVGTTIKVGSSTALGAANNLLSVAGTLNLNGNSPTIGGLTLAGGSTFNYTFGTSAVEGLTAGSLSTSGTNYFAFNPASLGGTGTYNLLTATSGGLAGTFGFSGADNLTVPVASIIAKNSSGNFFRLRLNNTGTSEQIVVSNDLPARMFTVLPYGSSITAGQSAQNPYNGGGYRQQLYQNLVNDGRFTPNFVGSSVALLATNPTSGNILSTANQLNHEGHPGWNTLQMLANLGTLNNGDPDANGGKWLAPNNGENPDVITVNIGGNDAVNYGATQASMIAAAQRLDATISEFNTLRPGVNTIISTIGYRGDNSGSYSTQGLDPYYNPAIGGIVFNHVLAGQSVGYLDLRSIIDYSTDISSDHIHPFQAGYDKMANAWYQSVAYGAAYWTGSQDKVWNTVNAGATNWATDVTLATDRQKSLVDSETTTYLIYPDVFFSNNFAALATTLGADTTVRSLNFTGGAAGPVNIRSGNTLTIGSVDTSSGTGTAYTLMSSGGITVQAGSGAHTVAADIVLGADQTWGNVSSSPLTVSGGISGSGNLTLTGAYTIYNPGTYIPNGTDYKNVAFTTTSLTVGGTGGFVLSGNNSYSGNTTLTTGAKLTINGTLSSTPSISIDSASSLVVNGTVNSSATVLLSGALSGTGTVGSVTTVDGATIGPGNVTGTLTARTVTLSTNATLNIACGSSSGSNLVVTGNAQINGLINVALLPHSSVTAFNREIVTVSGSLDTTGMRIGSVPSGLSAADFSLVVNGGHIYLQYGAHASGGSYSLFQSVYFTAAQQADPSVSGPTADANHDGLPNLIDYALGRDPTLPSGGSPFTESLQPVNTSSGASSVLTLSFYEPENPPSDAILNVHQGTDLTMASNWPVVASRDQSGNWTVSTGASVSEGAPSNGFTPVAIFGSLPGNTNPAVFMRLEAVLPGTASTSGQVTATLLPQPAKPGRPQPARNLSAR